LYEQAADFLNFTPVGRKGLVKIDQIAIEEWATVLVRHICAGITLSGFSRDDGSIAAGFILSFSEEDFHDGSRTWSQSLEYEVYKPRQESCYPSRAKPAPEDQQGQKDHHHHVSGAASDWQPTRQASSSLGRRISTNV
jgi:hypothetical protein